MRRAVASRRLATVTFALLRFGYWSLVLGGLSGSVLATVRITSFVSAFACPFGSV